MRSTPVSRLLLPPALAFRDAGPGSVEPHRGELVLHRNELGDLPPSGNPPVLPDAIKGARRQISVHHS